MRFREFIFNVVIVLIVALLVIPSSPLEFIISSLSHIFYILVLMFKAPFYFISLVLTFILVGIKTIFLNIVQIWSIYTLFIDYVFIGVDFCERFHYDVGKKVEFDNFKYFTVFLKNIFPVYILLKGFFLINYALAFNLFSFLFLKLCTYFAFGGKYCIKIFAMYIKLSFFIFKKYIILFFYYDFCKLLISLLLKILLLPIFIFFLSLTAALVVWCMFYIINSNNDYYNSRTYYYGDDFSKNVNLFFEKELLIHNKNKFGNEVITITKLKKVIPLILKLYIEQTSSKINKFFDKASDLWFCDNFLDFNSVYDCITKKNISVYDFNIILSKVHLPDSKDELEHFSFMYNSLSHLDVDSINKIEYFNNANRKEKKLILNNIISPFLKLFHNNVYFNYNKIHESDNFLNTESSFEKKQALQPIFLNADLNFTLKVAESNYKKWGAYLDLWGHEHCVHNEYYNNYMHTELLTLLLFKKDVKNVWKTITEREDEVADINLTHDLINARSFDESSPIISRLPMNPENLETQYLISTELEESSNGEDIAISGARHYSSKKIIKKLIRQESQNSYEDNDSSLAFRSVIVNKFNLKNINNEEISSECALTQISKNNKNYKIDVNSRFKLKKPIKKCDNEIKLNAPDDVVISIMTDSISVFLNANEDVSGSSKNIVTTSDAFESNENEAELDFWGEDDLCDLDYLVKLNRAIQYHPLKHDTHLKEDYSDVYELNKAELTEERDEFMWPIKNKAKKENWGYFKRLREFRYAAFILRLVYFPRHLFKWILMFAKLDFIRTTRFFYVQDYLKDDREVRDYITASSSDSTCSTSDSNNDYDSSSNQSSNSWTESVGSTSGESSSSGLDEPATIRRLSSSSEDDGDDSLSLSLKNSYGLIRRVKNDHLIWYNSASSSIFFKGTGGEISTWIFYINFIKMSFLTYYTVLINLSFLSLGIIRLFINDRCAVLILLYIKKKYFHFVFSLFNSLVIVYFMLSCFILYLFFSLLMVILWVHIVTALIYVFYSKILISIIYPFLIKSLTVIFMFFLGVVASVQKIAVVSSWSTILLNIWVFFDKIILLLLEFFIDIIHLSSSNFFYDFVKFFF